MQRSKAWHSRHIGRVPLPAAQLRRLLVFKTRMEVDAFLKEHEIFDYSAADFEQDRETLRDSRMREARP